MKFIKKLIEKLFGKTADETKETEKENKDVLYYLLCGNPFDNERIVNLLYSRIRYAVELLSTIEEVNSEKAALVKSYVDALKRLRTALAKGVKYFENKKADEGEETGEA